MTGGFFDLVLHWGKVVSTGFGKAGGVVAQVVGIGALDPDADETDDSAGELGDDSPMFGWGVQIRPLPPEVIDGLSMHAEVICARTADGLVPIGLRDLRLERVHSGLKEGSVCLPGYKGGFISHDVGPNGKQISTLYVPTAFDAAGAPTEALLITMNGDDKSITILTGGTAAPGSIVTLQQEDRSMTWQTTDGTSVMRLEPGKATLQFDQIVLNGTVVVGNPTGPIVPLLAGAASPPCPRLFLNPAS